MRKLMICAGLVMALLTTAAHAATFRLEYAGNFGVIDALLEGDFVTGSTNVVEISTISTLFFNGNLFNLPLQAASFTDLNGTGVISPGILSIDGSVLDFVGIDLTVGDGFALIGDPTGAVFLGGRSFGGAFEPFVLANYSLTSVAAIPVPAALPLLLSGLGVLGLVARRRRLAA